MMPEGLRPIRCQSCGRLICEADGTVVFRCPRCKRFQRQANAHEVNGKGHLVKMALRVWSSRAVDATC